MSYEASNRRFAIGALSGAAGVAALARLAQAGPLDPPPGPVAATGRTLQEIYDRIARTQSGVGEPRIPIQSLPGSATFSHVISEPGSYYLTGPIVGSAGKNGIEVAADNVVLDCRGHALRGAAGAGNAVVAAPSRTGLTIRDGQISGWPGAAIVAEQVHCCILSALTIDGCGNDGSGSPWTVRVGDGSAAVECIVRDNQAWGMFLGNSSHAFRTTARANAGVGILARGGAICHCTASYNGDTGIGLDEPGVIHNCDARENLYGIVVNYGVHVWGNSMSYNGIGLVTTQRRNLVDNNLSFFNGTGFDVRSNGSTLRNNLAAENSATGFAVSGKGHILMANTANGNGTNYDIATGNSHGPIVGVAGVGDISTVPGANHPWANFAY